MGNLRLVAFIGFFGCLFSSSLSLAGYRPWIVGGALTPNVTEVASIRKSGHHYCSASWIGPDLLLSAAHCQPGRRDRASMWVVHDSFGQAYKPIKWVVNKDYDDDALGVHDTMMVLVEPAGTHLKEHSVFALPSGDDLVPVDMISSGYGITSSDDESPDLLLRSVGISKVDCSDFYGTDVPLEDICYEGIRPAVAGTCSGDSGGPLYAVLEDGAKIVYGVTSWGTRPCGVGPSVFVDVQMHLDWIEMVMTAMGE